jgi:hypothetical protein
MTYTAMTFQKLHEQVLTLPEFVTLPTAVIFVYVSTPKILANLQIPSSIFSSSKFA